MNVSQPKSSSVRPLSSKKLGRKLLIGVNDLRTVSSKLADEMDGSMSNSKLASETHAGSGCKASWKCTKCKGVWADMSPSQRYKLNQGCPYCSNRRLLRGVNDLASLYPDLISQSWDYARNSASPSEVHPSVESYFWLCRNGHSTKRSIHRQLKSRGCSICSSRKLTSGINDFEIACKSSMRTDLLSQWSDENNTKPSEVFPMSNTKVVWMCRLGHRWTAAVSSRWTKGCPDCGRKRTTVGVNDLRTWARENRPRIIDEYSPLNELRIDEVSCRSDKSAQWKCECGYEWTAIISNRTAPMGSGCPRCTAQRSQGEIELADFVASISSEAVDTSDRKVLSGQEIDILLGNVGIEYQGVYWHSEDFIWRSRGITAEEHHRKKRDLAARRGVILLFVWEDDWSQSRKEIESALRSYIQDRGDIPDVLQILSKG